MKLKKLPGDFRVVERTGIQPSGGAFALYELEKESLGTPEAVNAILKCWNLPRRRISYGGMKDRHALTKQMVTIHRGPQSSLKNPSFTLTYLGQTEKPVEAKDIQSNQFQITLRSISPGDQPSLEKRLRIIQRIGVPNYFDDQRFGSLGESGEFIGHYWCKGNYERALYLALAERNSHDRPRESQQKAILRERWGDWLQCKNLLDRSHRRSVVTYLVDHPQNFKKALALLRTDLRGIYVAAFQSALWNRWLSRIIHQRFAPNVSNFSSASGDLCLPVKEDPNDPDFQWISALQLPLPTARQREWPNDLVGLLDEILQPFQMTRQEIRLKYPRDTFFSKGLRAAWLRPRELEYRWLEDELHSDKKALQLSFDLPRGCYATMVIKMLQRFG
jgi:tRNA pseudouridine13 synthase